MPLSHKGLRVKVVTGGEELPVYKQSLEDDKIVMGYIASVVGKSFTVVIDHVAGDDGYRCELAIDGQHVVSRLLSSRRPSTHESGVRTGPASERPFRFSDIRFQGLIEIKCLLAVEVKLKKPQNRRFKSKFITEDVPETSKKAGWHRVSLGDETSTEGQRWSKIVKSKIKTLDKNPRIVFRIRYQPAELLRANGILPMTTATSSANTAETVADQGMSSQNPTNGKRTRCAEPLDQTSKRLKPSSTNNRDPEPVPSSSIAHTRPKINPDAALGDVVVKNEANEESGETEDSDEELQALQEGSLPLP
ncbi:uncharacterized protein STEHIDRAFT_111719 [Stereum hirsutum FP-91666 SS1]|uniref:uncharacterized protein n=1 Tax=Stereum hirsutum (strain FP-91666) TaxID=721885 RepID=UPI0004449FA9|nr:uncharacterized protein STEHIDRAFT_111719 [Stereum hirsutum FP-91666 SS1]EIM86205.1 hypothetical protein STEHIDRAFT_111719 [Stereum hirsutum FP-91666 SS1]